MYTSISIKSRKQNEQTEPTSQSFVTSFLKSEVRDQQAAQQEERIHRNISISYYKKCETCLWNFEGVADVVRSSTVYGVQVVVSQDDPSQTDHSNAIDTCDGTCMCVGVDM